MTTNEAARQLGYAAFPVVLLAIAALIGWRMGRKRQPPKFVAWPVGVAAVLLLAGMIGMQMKAKRSGADAPAGETR